MPSLWNSLPCLGRVLGRFPLQFPHFGQCLSQAAERCPPGTVMLGPLHEVIDCSSVENCVHVVYLGDVS